jgi:hypothetical protein
MYKTPPRVSKIKQMNPVYTHPNYNLKYTFDMHTFIYAYFFPVISLPQVTTPVTVQPLPSPIPSTRPAHLVPLDMISQIKLRDQHRS